MQRQPLQRHKAEEGVSQDPERIRSSKSGLKLNYEKSVNLQRLCSRKQMKLLENINLCCPLSLPIFAKNHLFIALLHVFFLFQHLTDEFRKIKGNFLQD